MLRNLISAVLLLTTVMLPASERQGGWRLAGQSSPYLQLHAANPVEWFAWSEAALNKARRENKPLFISIGYFTCHWCHVMARESFSNPAIAALLNEHFVAIKIDREFIEPINPAKTDQGLLNLIVSIAEKLNMDTIAEGVETETQANILREMGCMHAQGFYFKESINAKDTEKYLKSYNRNRKKVKV